MVYQEPQKELSGTIAKTARLLHRASSKPTTSNPVRISTLPPTALFFFQIPHSPLPSPIVHIPTLIPPDLDSFKLLHVPFPRVISVQILRVRFSTIVEVIPPLCFDVLSHTPRINHVSSLRVPIYPTNILDMDPKINILPPKKLHAAKNKCVTYQKK